MILVYDNSTDIWVWVAKEDHDLELSPQFEYEEDAHAWFTDMSNYFKQQQ